MLTRFPHKFTSNWLTDSKQVRISCVLLLNSVESSPPTATTLKLATWLDSRYISGEEGKKLRMSQHLIVPLLSVVENEIVEAIKLERRRMRTLFIVKTLWENSHMFCVCMWLLRSSSAEINVVGISARSRLKHQKGNSIVFHEKTLSQFFVFWGEWNYVVSLCVVFRSSIFHAQ